MNKECFVNETRALPVLIVDHGCFDPEVVILGSCMGSAFLIKGHSLDKGLSFRFQFVPVSSSR